MTASHQFTVTISGNCTRDQAREVLRDALFGEDDFAQMSPAPVNAAEYVGMSLDRRTGDLLSAVDFADD